MMLYSSCLWVLHVIHYFMTQPEDYTLKYLFSYLLDSSLSSSTTCYQ